MDSCARGGIRVPSTCITSAHVPSPHPSACPQHSCPQHMCPQHMDCSLLCSRRAGRGCAFHESLISLAPVYWVVPLLQSNPGGAGVRWAQHRQVGGWVAEPHRHGDPQNEGRHLPGLGVQPRQVLVPWGWKGACCSGRSSPGRIPSWRLGTGLGQSPGGGEWEQKPFAGGQRINPVCGRPGQHDGNSGSPRSKPALLMASEDAGFHTEALTASLYLW